MDLRQLRALVAVADHGTFSAAADALDTVQSNVSTHIARLEKELGATLIDRSINRLTLEGEAVVRRSRRISSELDNISADMAAFRNEVMGEVGLGMIQTTAMWLLPQLLTELEERYPDTSIRVIEGSTATLEPQLSSGLLDLAVIQEPSRSPDVSVEELFEEDIVLIAPLNHPLAKAHDLSVADLKGIPLLLPTLGTGPRFDLDAIARRSGISLEAKAEIDSVELTVSLVAQGRGPALVPVTGVPKGENEHYRIVHVENLPTRRVALAQHRRVPLSVPMRAVKDLMLEIITKQSSNREGIRLLSTRTVAKNS